MKLAICDDVNMDGKVDVFDLVMLRHIYIGE